MATPADLMQFASLQNLLGLAHSAPSPFEPPAGVAPFDPDFIKSLAEAGQATLPPITDESVQGPQPTYVPPSQAPAAVQVPFKATPGFNEVPVPGGMGSDGSGLTPQEVFERNRPYLKPGPYDYALPEFAGDNSPYSLRFSAKSPLANAQAPHWVGNKLVDDQGRVLYDQNNNTIGVQTSPIPSFEDILHSPETPDAPPKTTKTPTSHVDPRIQAKFAYPLNQPLKAPGMLGLSPQQIAGFTRRVESGGNYSALNPHSSASGAYQNTNGNWNGFGGYSAAALAPPWVQDQKFQIDLNKALKRYGGDIFKVIASHYYPRYADNPSLWGQPIKVPAYTNRGGKHIPEHNVGSVANYVQTFVDKSGDPTLKKAYEQYLAG